MRWFSTSMAVLKALLLWAWKGILLQQCRFSFKGGQIPTWPQGGGFAVQSADPSSADLLDLLLRHGANHNIAYAYASPIELASMKSQLDVVKLLLQAGANPLQVGMDRVNAFMSVEPESSHGDSLWRTAGHITAQDIIFRHLSILDDFLWDVIYSANGAGDADGADVADSADGASKWMVRHSFRPHCNKLCFKKFHDVFYLWLFEDLATNLFLLDSWDESRSGNGFKASWRILIKCSMKTTKTIHPKTNQRCVTVLHRNLLKCCVASLGWKGTRVSSMFNRQAPIDLSTQSLWPPKYL